MTLQVAPFEVNHLEDAAALVCARYAALRMQAPLLPTHFADRNVVRDKLAELLQTSPGVVAIRQGKVVGGLYSSRGQEGISVGSAYALGPDDVVAPLIRNLGVMLVRGVRPREAFTQYCARATSPCRLTRTTMRRCCSIPATPATRARS